MKTIIERPVLAIIFFVIIIVFGIYSFKNLPIETVPDPEQGVPQLNVQYIWLGASPDMILRRVLIPAEEQLTQVKGIEKIESNAQQNYGTIDVEFSRDTRMNFAEVEIRERLNRLQRELPRQVRNPLVVPRIPDEFKQEPLLKIGVYARDYSIHAIRKIAEKEIVPHLKAIPGIETVDIWGGVEPEIKIQTNMSRLKKFRVDLQAIQTRLNQHFYTKHSLSFTRNSGEITLSLTENPDKIEDIQDIVIHSLGEKKVYLKEVADVFLGYGRLTNERRYQGEPYLQIEMFKEPAFSHLEMANKVKAKLQYLGNKLHDPIEFVIQSDDSRRLERQLIKLGKIAFLILIIIFVILLVIIRDIKSSLLIFSSVFFSVFATLTAIYLFDISLNLLTLSGLALGFGLFVDNAVVVFDSILRFRERGHGNKESAVEGAKAVILPVLASTFTTIIVFFSFALLFKDRLRVYYLPLAYIIAISLVSSIAVSFVLIPSLSARIKLKLKNNINKKNNQKKELFKKGRFFPFLLRYPLVVILPIILLLSLSYVTFKEEVSFGRFFGWFSQQKVAVWLRFPSGAEFEDIKDAILKFEKVAVDKPYAKEVNTTIGSRQAHMVITFPPKIEASAYPLQLKQELVGLATNLAGVGVYVAGFDQEPYYYNPDTGSHLPYDIRLSGYNLERLMDYSNEVTRTLLRHKRIKEAEIQTDMKYYWAGKTKYYAFRVNRDKLKRYKLNPEYLNYIIQTMLREGSGQARLKYEDKEMSVEIKASDVEDLELDDILNKYHYSLNGTPFRLRDVVDVEFSVQKGGITRENQEYKAMVQWDYLGSAKIAQRFHDTLYERLQVPPGFKKSLEQFRWRMTEEEEGQLWYALLLSFGLIVLLLGILYESFFQPFIIVASIPLALIGVFIAFVVMDYSFDSTAYIGIILLMGIVVNNSIILIDNINRHLRQTNKLVESIVIGTKERIRPIFMTSMTTILGMLPLVILREGTSASQSDIWSSLALCTVGGLTTSALLIPFVLPIFYYLFYKLQKFILGTRAKPANDTDTPLQTQET
jgi:HAE1 family hydrophobic/amphiphilic exporter-1